MTGTQAPRTDTVDLITEPALSDGWGGTWHGMTDVYLGGRAGYLMLLRMAYNLNLFFTAETHYLLTKGTTLMKPPRRTVACTTSVGKVPEQ